MNIENSLSQCKMCFIQVLVELTIFINYTFVLNSKLKIKSQISNVQNISIMLQTYIYINLLYLDKHKPNLWLFKNLSFWTTLAISGSHNICISSKVFNCDFVVICFSAFCQFKIFSNARQKASEIVKAHINILVHRINQ